MMGFGKMRNGVFTSISAHLVVVLFAQFGLPQLFTKPPVSVDIIPVDLLVLDRKVADKRVFPAIDLLKSGTRKEELLVDKTELTKVFVLRRILNPMGTTDAIEFLLSKLKQTKTNSEFFDSMNN